MTRRAVCVASVAVMCLAVSSEARAEPVRITGGVLDFNGALGSGVAQAGVLSIVGTRGFSADGLVDSTETRVDPISECVVDCQPGSTIPVGAMIVGSGLANGRVTLDGQTYSDINGSMSPDDLFLDLTGTIGIPAWQNAPVSISAPFDADGFFRHTDRLTGNLLFQVPIGGGGTATLEFGARASRNMGPGDFPLRLRGDAHTRTSHADDGERTSRCCADSGEKTPRPEDCYSVVNEHADRVTAFRRSYQ